MVQMCGLFIEFKVGKSTIANLSLETVMTGFVEE